jgi:cyclase
MGEKNLFHSRHFHLEQLAKGVYAAINAEEGWAICNAGIVDLGDRTLVYDAFTSPQAASDLKDAAERLTGRSVCLVINSHYHNDHIWGNQVFDPETEIISTTKTRHLISTESATEVTGYREMAPERLKSLQAKYDETSDEMVRHQLKAFIVDYQAIIAALPILQVRLPNLTFTGELAFYGPRRSARLIPFDGGHSGNDSILHLPEDGIVFMADLLFIGGHPYLADGDPDTLPQILAEIRSLNPKILVPGHGPVGHMAHLDGMEEYINTLNALVSKAIQSGISEQEIEKITIPEKYQHMIFPTFFTDNLRFLYRRQTKNASRLVE